LEKFFVHQGTCSIDANWGKSPTDLVYYSTYGLLGMGILHNLCWLSNQPVAPKWCNTPKVEIACSSFLWTSWRMYGHMCYETY